MSAPEEPRDHVRRPELPWRASTLTECGKAITDVKAWIERDELAARVKKHGQARTAFTVCMTCWHTAQRWPTFTQSPVQALRREVYNGYVRDEAQLAAELRGIAALVDKYRDEFDAFLAGLADTSSLEEHRRQRRNRTQTGGRHH